MSTGRLLLGMGIVGLLIAAAFVAGDRATYAAEPSAEPRTEAEAARHFDAKIAPLLAERCLECHDSTVQEGRLDLSRRETALAGGRNGPAIVPGDPEQSLAWDYVDFGDMPPEEREPLSPEEKQLLREWIEAGAVWSGERIDLAALRRDSRALDQWLQRLTVTEYIETVRSTVGVDIEQEARELLPPDHRADGFTNTAYNLSVDLGHVEAYAELAAMIVERMDVQAFVAEHADCESLDDACMRELIAGMGHWLLRGPLEPREVDTFMSVADAVAEEGGDQVEAVSYVIEAMLQSPRFIYRIELQRGDGTPRPVSAYELASRMSYIIWGGPPDRELLAAADAGQLSDEGEIRRQVQRMLDDPRAVKRSQQFIDEWMGLERLTSLRPNAERFPEWSDQLAQDMRDETLAYFTDVIWNQQRPVWDALNAQVTFATPRLAKFYELGDAPAAPVETEPASNPGRVTRGLAALYTFQGEGGSIIRDVAGVGEPIDLHIEDPSAVIWDETGMTVNEPTRIASEQPARRLMDAIQQTDALTIEAWITPANTTQEGPARIVTLSGSSSTRNFTLGQDGDRFDIRLRTAETSDNGIPNVNTEPGTLAAEPVHVVYSRNADGEVAIYIDGREVKRDNVGGNLLNWNEHFLLAIACEITDERYWEGTYHLVAIYDEPLSTQDVLQNHAAGPRNEAPSGTQLAYEFEQEAGETIPDRSGAGEAADLRIEDSAAVEWAYGGLKLNDSTSIATAEPPRKLIEAVQRSQAITLEAWVTPADAQQEGPARIVTISSGTGERNFTLGQTGDRYDVRLRTTATDANGMPGISSEAGSGEARPTHVVYTRDASGRATLYVNGQRRGSGDVSGDLSNWDEGYRLILGNESGGDRPWLGTLHAVNLYSRALTADEIAERGSRMWRYDVASVPSRGGLLTQASVLTVGGDEASTVSRGLFVLHDILDSAVGSAPPGVDTTPVPPEPGLSQRGLAEARLADSSCVGCHSRFEPLAFGLEKFNGIGRFEEVDEHGNELREDGEMLLPGADEPVPYETVSQMMDLLADSGRVHLTVTRKLTQFALGRPLVGADDPLVDEIHQTAKQNGGTYESLVTAIVMSDLVQKTRTEAQR